MKNTIVRIALALVLVVTFASVPAPTDGGSPAPPYCCPGCICTLK